MKENQKQLYEDVALFFKLAQQNDLAKVDHTRHRTVDNNHGRMEIRHCWAVSGEESLSFLRAYGDWPQLTSLVMIQSERQLKGKTTRETH